MKLRSLMLVTALLGTMVLTDTGCRTKAGGWRWPWQKDTTALSNGVELENPDVDTTDIGTITDDTGTPVTGARFEDSLQKVQGLHLEPVYFGFDSYSVPPSELPKIKAVATYLQENAQHVLVVEGHCDERGNGLSGLPDLRSGLHRLRVQRFQPGGRNHPDRIRTRFPDWPQRQDLRWVHDDRR